MEFFCTAGRGTEEFVDNELRDKFNEHLEKVHITDGKVFFKVKDSCIDIGNKIMKLMTVERLFIYVLSKEKQKIKGKRELLTLLHTEMKEKLLWEKATEVLHKVKSSFPALKEPDSVLHVDSTDDEMSKQGVPENDPDESDLRPDNISFKSHQEVSQDFMNRSEDNLPQKGNISLKRKIDKTIDSDRSVAAKKRFVNEGCSFQQSTVQHCNEDGIGQQKLAFRVSCKFSGSVRHKLNAQRSVKQMGVLISKLMGWKTDLNNPSIEICIHMNDDTMVVGIPVFKEPLSKRRYIKHYGLRSTVSRIMAVLAQIQPADIVLDPMCGKATILMEGANMVKSAVYLGMDRDENQIKLAEENIKHGASSQQLIQIIQGNALNLPFSDNSLNKIITDAPFGQNHKIETDLYDFYLKMLREACRVLKSDGTLVLLTSTEVKNFLLENLTCAEGILVSKEEVLNSDSKGKTMKEETPVNEQILERTCLEDKESVTITGRPNVCVLDNSMGQTWTRSNTDHCDTLSGEGGCIFSENCRPTSHESVHQVVTDNEMKSQVETMTKLEFRTCSHTETLNQTQVYTSSCFHRNSAIQILKTLFTISKCCYIKLGITDSYLCVLKKT